VPRPGIVPASGDVTPVTRVGTAGWANPGDQRDERKPGLTHLQHYAERFNCTEINSSFYRLHRRATYERWAQSTPSDFSFAVKMPKALSHDTALRCLPGDLDEFLESVQGLGSKLAVLLLQLPPRSEFQPRIARRFFALLTKRTPVPVVCEPRHPSWSAAGAQRLFGEFDISWVFADPVRVSHAWRCTGRILYHRLHGAPHIYWSSYSAGYLRDLAAELTQERGCVRQVWSIFDNTAAGAAWLNAQSLNDYLRAGGVRGAATQNAHRSGHS
jgi:uncharacterized protein YecE (DUF72 family)